MTPPIDLGGIRPDITAGAVPVFRPVKTDEIVTIGDRIGIFTPLTGKDADNTENLSKIIDVLRSELAEAQSDNAALRARVDELSAPARSADNLADGVQNALDELADRLGTMTNTTSDFAVREFVLESKVHLDVTAVGTIGFQFVRPGEVVDAAALSTVKLSVVPVPKPQPDPIDPTIPDAAPASEVRTADRPVESLGLSDGQAQALRSAHISTTRDFARVATHATAQAELVSMLGVTREDLGRYVLIAGLLTVPGVDATTARLLYAAGIHDAATLAAAKPDELVRRLAAAAKDAGSTPPKVEEVTSWVAAATALTQTGDARAAVPVA